jgi:hypothetical protein
VILKLPLERIATRPLYLPLFLPVLTTALTRSPVWKPLTVRAPLAEVRGKPKRSIRHICRFPCPVALMSKGTTSLVLICSGVLLPTQEASSQWALGRSLMVRLYFVNPPDPHSTGKPNALSRSYNAYRVALTAEASLSGALACDRIRFKTSGLVARNSWISRVPLAWLQASQARARLLTLFVPPLARG